MNDELEGIIFSSAENDDEWSAVVARGESATVNHIILNGTLLVLTDGRTLNVPPRDARVTNTWSPSTGLEIWKDKASAAFPLCVRNTVQDEEVHGKWAA